MNALNSMFNRMFTAGPFTYTFIHQKLLSILLNLIARARHFSTIPSLLFPSDFRSHPSSMLTLENARHASSFLVPSLSHYFSLGRLVEVVLTHTIHAVSSVPSGSSSLYHRTTTVNEFADGGWLVGPARSIQRQAIGAWNTRHVTFRYKLHPAQSSHTLVHCWCRFASFSPHPTRRRGCLEGVISVMVRWISPSWSAFWWGTIWERVSFFCTREEDPGFRILVGREWIRTFWKEGAKHEGCRRMVLIVVQGSHFDLDIWYLNLMMTFELNPYEYVWGSMFARQWWVKVL